MGIDARIFIKLDSPINAQGLNMLNANIREAFGDDAFDPDNGAVALEEIEVYEQDGPDINRKSDQMFIRVHLWTHYYGMGYERGDLPLIIALAGWLDHNFPGCEVWYGGDSSGKCAYLFDKLERDRLFYHFAYNGHRPYHQKQTMRVL